MQEQWGYVAISFIIGVAIAFSSSLLLIVFCLFLNVFFCLYRTSRKTFIFCIVACFNSAIYTSYVQTWNKPLGESYGVTRGVI
ncbi:DNA internalization-related competence protein ComEC/Rec2, partial [Bacillus cereus]|nr:DNA internalization-related competence protein ComEC/Rec2 [Bacillus cereus]